MRGGIRTASPLWRCDLRVARSLSISLLRCRRWSQSPDVSSGVCHIYVPHTTAGVIINEGYDPDVARDMEVALDRLIPHKSDYRHAEGNSDSHIKTALVGSSQSVFIEQGRLGLGRWQAIFFCEFDGPRHRDVRVKIVED